jgi:hypothetical protein
LQDNDRDMTKYSFPPSTNADNWPSINPFNK